MTGTIETNSEVKKIGILNPAFVNPPPFGTRNDQGTNCQQPSQATSSSLRVGKEEECMKVDPFAICLEESELETVKSNPFLNILKFLCVFGLLYIFICSLDFMASAFRLISGKAAGAVFQNSYIENPVVGLMIGILVTVLVQSSSTSTSIIVSMVNAKILHVQEAIPMIMGSNIGTSVTNTIVSLTQIGDRAQFRRAFAGATVHDMFNWLTVITLLTIEITTHMLEKLTKAIVNSAFNYEGKQQGTEIKILKHITEPFTKIIIKIDKNTLTGWSHNDTRFENRTLSPCYNAKLDYPNNTDLINKKCDYLFSKLELEDAKIGIILLIISLFLLCLALIMIVKILNSMLKGTIARLVKRVINADIPYVPWLTGYVAILVGAVMTVIVQSSSIFTSTLTPLIGLGLISVDRAYPLTLGSNIGTTTTALLASVAGEGDGLKYSVQIAFVHLFFNIIGILIFYPIPFMRLPIPMAKMLGNITADYRWFAIFYIVMMFFLLPAFVFGLSMGGPLVMKCVGIPLLIILVLVIIINILQNRFSRILPSFLKTWDFLPLPLHSLKPYDRIFLAAPCCETCRIPYSEEPVVVVVDKTSEGLANPTFEEPSMSKI